LWDQIWRDLSDSVLPLLRADETSNPAGAFVDLPTGECLAAGSIAVTSESQPDLVSVVVCSRDRTETLRGCLLALQHLEHTNFEVLVVDNAPRTAATAEMFRQHFESDARFRYALEPMAGLARARNRGVAEARGVVVAFTDDDVRVDPWWLQGIEAGFRRHPRAGCVTGLIPAAELRTPAQQYFDQRVGWSASCETRVYDLGEHRPRSALFPFTAGQFGAGANFAFNREYLMALGGFDEALGAGSPAGGGEDLDIFARAVLAGGALVYEPSAIVWHIHRGEADELMRQMHNYGQGLTAYLTKHLTSRRSCLRLLSRMPFAVLHGCAMLRGGRDRPIDGRASAPLGGMVSAEVRGMVRGPFAYYRGRRLVRRSLPGPSASWGGRTVEVDGAVHSSSQGPVTSTVLGGEPSHGVRVAGGHVE
jgi:GT2 family glycosyltransferase